MRVPEDWRFTTIEEHIDLLSGFPFKSDDYSNDPNDIPLLRGDNIEPGSLRWRDAKRWPHDKYEELKKYQLQTSDFVIAMDRTWISVGLKVAEVKSNDTPCLLVQRVARIRAKKSFSQSLLKQIFSTHRFEQYVKGVQTETAVPHISAAQIKEYPVLVPPLPEQQKIAQILSTWDKAIEKLEALIAAKQKRKKALMQQLLTGKKRFAGFEGEWKTFHLAELFKERNETGHVGLNLLSITREKGVIPRNEVERKDTSNDNKSKYLRICAGDIGYNTMRMWQGVSALSTLEGIISPAYTVCIPTDKIDGKFAAYLFKSMPIVHLFQRYSQGLTSDTWNLKFHHFGEIKVFISEDVQEQKKIASVLTAADTEIQTHQKQLAALKEQKKGLMQQLLTGKKRVKVEAHV